MWSCGAHRWCFWSQCLSLDIWNRTFFFFCSHSFWLYAILSLDPHHGFPNFCYKKHRFLLCQTLSTKEIYLCVFIDDNLIYSTHLTILCGITNWPIVVNAEANIGAPFPLASLFLFFTDFVFYGWIQRHIISRLDSISRSFSKANKIILHSKSNTWLQWTNKRRIYSKCELWYICLLGALQPHYVCMFGIQARTWKYLFSQLIPPFTLISTFLRYFQCFNPSHSLSDIYFDIFDIFEYFFARLENISFEVRSK